MKRRFALFLISIHLPVLLVVALAKLAPDFMEGLELKTYDQRLRLSRGVYVDPRIVVIDVDDRSIATLGRWPWPRRIHGELVQALAAAEARAVVFDVVFPYTGSPDDAQFIEASAGYSRVFLPMDFKLKFGLAGNSIAPDQWLSRDPSLKEFLWHPRIEGSGAAPRASGEGLVNFTFLASRARAMGHISATPDRDGTLRRVPLLIQLADGYTPALSLAVATYLMEARLDTLRVKWGRDLSFLTKEGKLIKIPLDKEGRFFIKYAGRRGETFPHYSYGDVMEAFRSGRYPELRRTFQGKVVIVSNVLSGPGNLGSTPLKNGFPLGEVQAHILNSLLLGDYLRPAGPSVRIPAFVLLLAAVAFLGKFLGPLALVGAAGVLAGAYLGVAQYLFASEGMVLPVVIPLMGAFLLLLFTVVRRYSTEKPAK